MTATPTPTGGEHTAPSDTGFREPERYARLRDLFEAALAVPAEQRLDWLATHCPLAEDRAAVLRLLAADDEPGALDGDAAVQAGRIGNNDFLVDSLVGSRIGAYRLVRLLGQGGMAAVFLGERDDPAFRQQVAIKLLRRGLYSQIEQRLFQRERQVLAALSHPNIAHLFDGGVTEAGVPYLVLEYVDGVPITDFVAARRLDLRARLRLFITVARAVAAAHRSLIVHRDLKPANILVNRDGQAKLLDFGIAKLLDDEGEGATRTGLAALTPGYAAPEQFTGGPISTATDAYALGVLLHELLVGARPAQAGGDSRRPSARSDLFNAPPAPLPLPAAALRAALRGDLDNIVLKALAAEQERRYASAAELADDIERYLDAQPVSAHPPSRWYRTRKFVRRHRGGVVMTTVLALMALTSLGTALLQARRASLEASRAQAAAAEAHAANQELRAQFAYIDSLLQVLAPSTVEARELDRSKLIAEAARRATVELASEPSALAGVELSLARVAGSAGDYVQALRLAESAHARRQQLLGDDSAATADALSITGGFLDLSKPPRHEEALRRHALALAVLRRHAPETPSLVAAIHRQSDTFSYLDQFDKGISALQEADRLCRGAIAGESVCEDIWENLGVFYTNKWQGELAVPFLERAYSARRRRLGEEHAETLELAGLLAWGYAQGGDFARAVPLAEQTYAARARIDAHPTQPTLLALRRLSRIVANTGDAERATELNAEYLKQARALYGENHRDTILAYMDAANTAYSEGLFAEAERQYARAANGYRSLPGGGDLQAVLAASYHAYALRELGRAAQALPIQERALQELQERFGDRPERIAAALNGLAATKSALGRHDDAIRDYDRSIELYRAIEGLSAPEVELVRTFRAKTLLDMGRAGEAEAELRASLAVIAAATGLPPRPYWERFAFLVEAACRNGADDCAQLRDQAQSALQRPLPGIVKWRLRAALATAPGVKR